MLKLLTIKCRDVLATVSGIAIRVMGAHNRVYKKESSVETKDVLYT